MNGSAGGQAGMGTVWVRTLAWLVLVGGLLALYPRFRPVGPPLADVSFEAPNLQPAPGEGTAVVADPEGAGHCLRLEGGRAARWGLKVDHAGADTYLRVSYRMRSAGLVPGPEPHHCGVVSVYQLDARGRGVGTLPNSGLMIGDHAFTRVGRTVPSAPATRRVSLLVRNLGTAGTLWVDDLKLEVVTDHLDWWVVLAVAYGSALWVGLGWARALGFPSSKLRVPTWLLLALVVYAAVCPRAQITYLSDTAENLLARVARLADPPPPKPLPEAAPKKADAPSRPAPTVDPDVPDEPPTRAVHGLPLSKKGHAFFFALLGASSMLWCLRGSGRPGRLMAALVCLAAATEILQLGVLGRTPSPRDAGLDLAGICVGAATAALIARWAFPRDAGR